MGTHGSRLRNTLKLKDNKDCQCYYRGDAELIQDECRYGRCVIMRCPWCNMISVEWGPILCKHKEQWYREFVYPDMAPQATHWGRKGTRRRKRRSHKVKR